LATADTDAASLDAAWRGLGYCERKLGDPVAAESAYLKLLARQPTADTHFLLGQFYEDAQQAGPARDHLQQAAALDPARYREPADALLRRLRRAHFGCWVGTSN
jgi:tetratricopeptide (TPR) repeat protein